MTSIDNAGIAIAIAITAIFLGIAATMGATQDAGPVVKAPVVSKTIESQSDSMSEKADAMAAKKAADAMAAKKAADAMAAKKAADAMAAKKAADAMAATGPTTHSVDIPKGTSVPGCEENNSCFSPADITINAGDTVEWINVDTAAHTVTGGSPSDGPSGVFDSSLVMANASYAFTFNDAGSYDYFCMVHPWMVGSVTVN
ncbi:MAG: cupredoxin domain-containing protein [Candidatus Nitrosopumilus sp. bin_32a]